ncbi:MAG: terminase small subunit [Pseudohongiella sp.]|nr:terminase small subunit [Pseudohongiella sp.]
MNKLSDKQKAFVSEYLIDLNGTQAAIRAGYSKNTAKQIATENLAKPVLAEAIRDAIERRTERTEIKADYVLKQAVKLHERCMQEIQPVTDKKGRHVEEEGRPVYSFNAAGAAKALQLVGNHVDVQAFQDKKVISGPGGEAIKFDHQFTVEFVDASSKNK